MTMMRGNSRGRKEEGNTTIEGRRSRDGPKDAKQKPTNGGAQLEAEALAERQSRQTDNTTTNDRVGGNNAVGLERRGANVDAEGVKRATLQPTN